MLDTNKHQFNEINKKISLKNVMDTIRYLVMLIRESWLI